MARVPAAWPDDFGITPSPLARAKEAARRTTTTPAATAGTPTTTTTGAGTGTTAPATGLTRDTELASQTSTTADSTAEATAARANPAEDTATRAAPAEDTAKRAAATKDTGAGSGATGNTAAAGAGDGRIDLDKPVVVTVGSPSGGRVTRVLRHANPVRVARTAGRSTHAWAKRPAGRLIVPTVIAALLLGGAGTAGAYLVPQALEANPSPSATPAFGVEAAEPGASGAAAPPPLPPLDDSAIAAPPVSGGRPADALATWAQGVGTRAGIPVVAVQAYGYAELVAARTAPSCRLSWTTLAAIAKVESSHGSANGAVLGADGMAMPSIRGLELDGKGGRQLIRDTDRGELDGDTTFDRAVGPMQFIPATWREMKVDADNSGVADPNDIDDAAVAAALYLCRGGRDMSRADSWWDGILSYNAVQPYAQKVFDAANDYGQRSRV